ncbi:tyrosine-type recombinase/integrase [Nocardioides bruguierae]|uniref:Tyrosine-type recombinase/integrase n=1 Tax=Nocardioides bruguierae TaxID=2945102 RepID=A0A9X2DA78_9ACTN|nr:tyrosine-type recombinase/integrase [Nocardioides bruguierae]MCM0622200.1 tyrosine-type recombinase/integrase [Nocardioides bruguierae]
MSQRIGPAKVLEFYVTWMRSWGASAQTVNARRKFAQTRLSEWGLTGFTVDAVRAVLGRDDISAWTRYTYYNHLVCLCSYLATAGFIPHDPMQGVRRPTHPRSLPRPLSEDEVSRILVTVTGPTRDWVVTGLVTGLRVSEIAKLRGEDVSQGGLYVEGKGGSRAELPVHPDLWEIAQRHPRHGYWWPGPEDGHVRTKLISSKVATLFSAMGIDGGIHRTRHTFATRLLRSGANIRAVQQLMRHSSLSTTAAYTAVTEDEMLSALLLLPGGGERAGTTSPADAA